MTEGIELENKTKVLVFPYNSYIYSFGGHFDKPIATGIVVGNYLSEDMSYHGSPSYYRIYKVVDENDSNKTYTGTHKSGVMGCGDCYFRTVEEYKTYLKYKIVGYEEDMQKIQKKIDEVREQMKKFEDSEKEKV